MADMVRVFAVENGTTIGDVSFDSTAANFPQVILEVEASAAECAGAQAYRVGGFARDYLSGAVGALVPAAGTVAAGNVCIAGQWPNRNHQFVFDLPAAVTGVAAQGGIVELVGVVSVGAPIAGADADFDTNIFTWVV